MTSPFGEAGSSATAGGPAATPGHEEQEPRVVIRDKRRLDPETGTLRTPAVSADGSTPADDKEATMTDETGDQPYRGRHARPGEGDGTPSTAGESAVPGVPGGWPGEDDMPAQRPTSPTSGAASEAAARAAYEDAPKAAEAPAEAVVDEGAPVGDADEPPADGAVEAPADAEQQDVPVEDAPVESASDEQSADAALAAQRLADLQMLQAEYVNYKRRVDRDRDAAKVAGTQAVVESMIPVLDEIELARQHGDLESGPFVKIAEKLEAVLTKHGIERYGQPGDTFDPAVHEAIMHTQAELAPGTTDTTVVQVMQPGYRIGDRIVRAALVAVADPQ